MISETEQWCCELDDCLMYDAEKIQRRITALGSKSDHELLLEIDNRSADIRRYCNTFLEMNVPYFPVIAAYDMQVWSRIAGSAAYLLMERYPDLSAEEIRTWVYLQK